jgi:hypothetical protein
MVTNCSNVIGQRVLTCCQSHNSLETMTEKHPITPPAELIEAWIELSRPSPVGYVDPNVLATHAARWGADQQCGKSIEGAAGSDGAERATGSQSRCP